MDCRTGYEYPGSDHHLCIGGIGMFHGYLSPLLSGSRDHVSDLSGTGDWTHSPELGMAAF